MNGSTYNDFQPTTKHTPGFCGCCGLEASETVQNNGLCTKCYNYAMSNQLVPCFICKGLTPNTKVEICSNECKGKLANRKWQGSSDAFSDERADFGGGKYFGGGSN